MGLNANQQRMVQQFPWQELIPLVFRLVAEVRRNGLFSEEAIALIIQIVQLVMDNLQQETMSAQDWRDLLDLIMKYLPILIELIGGINSGDHAGFCETSPRR